MTQGNIPIPMWAKGLIVIGVVAAIGLSVNAVAIAVKRRKNEKESKQEVDATGETIGVLTKSGLKPTIDTLKTKQTANSIFTALNGAGSDEQAVYRAFTNVGNDLDVVNVIKAYGVRELNSGVVLVPNFKGSLSQSLTNELSSEEIKALNDLLSRKGIKYRF